MTKKRFIMAMLSVMLLLFTAVTGTWTYFTAEKRTDSGLSTAKVDGIVVETFDQAQKNVMPGDTVQKIVNVRNGGNADVLVRIKIDKVWKNGENTTNLPTNNIIPALNLDKWIDGGDGYYYYSGILKAGETTQRALFDTFTVDAGNTGNEYLGKTANIDVTMEVIQATEGALRTWGKTFAQLKIAAPVGTQAAASYVSFVNPQSGFQCQPVNTDLFAAFKKVLPGETRTQQIEVQNAYTSPVEIFLRAEVANQSAATPEQLALINNLLQQYAVIKITEDGRTLYQGAAWGNYPNEGIPPNTMKYNISLGRFDPRQTRILTVELQLNPQLGNEYQDLLGMVRWVFVANESLASASPKPTPGATIQPIRTPSFTRPPTTWGPKPSTPQTGDDSMLLWLIGEFVAAAVAMMILAARYKKSTEQVRKEKS